MICDDTRKVILIGTGFVGMSYAYSMLNQGVCDELVLIDMDKNKAIGEAMDLNHGLAFSPRHMKIYAGDYTDCKDADIVVITAGAPQKEGETRLDLVHKNAKIIKGIVENIMANEFNGIILVTSNPVDIMTYVAYTVSGLPKHRVFGSGTSLDSARLRYLLSDYLKVDSKNIHAYIIGEHGDSEFTPWSNAYVGIKPLLDVVKEHDEYQFADLEQIYVDVRDAAYKIIERKRATFYGIGMALCHITKVILNDSNTIVPVSAYMDHYYGVNDVYIGMPAVLNRDGVREIVTFNMTKTDQDKFTKSAQILKDIIKELNLS
jgi:L-lactate dehydrogenase